MTQSIGDSDRLREASRLHRRRMVRRSRARGATFDGHRPVHRRRRRRARPRARGTTRAARSRRRPTRSRRGRRRLPAVRQAIFLRAADILESRRDEVVDLLARETGATFGFGMFQMHFTPGLLRQAAGSAYAPIGEVIPSDIPGAMAMGLRQPGRCRRRDRAVERGADPLAALDHGAARARQHGRAEAVRVVAGLRRHALGRDLRRGGPAGRACSTSSRTRRARPPGIGDELVENPAVRRLNFTGSTATGRRLAEAAVVS